MNKDLKKIKAIIAISLEANRVINIVKAKHELRTKSEAIETLTKEYLKHVPHSFHKEQEIKKFRELYG